MPVLAGRGADLAVTAAAGRDELARKVLAERLLLAIYASAPTPFRPRR